MNVIYNSIIENGHYTRRNGYKPSLFKNDKCKTWFIDKKQHDDAFLLNMVKILIDKTKELANVENVYVVEWSLREPEHIEYKENALKLEIRIVYD